MVITLLVNISNINLEFMFIISLIRNSLNFIDHFQQKKKIIKFLKKN